MTLSELFQKHAVLTEALEEIRAIEAERDTLRAELAEIKAENEESIDIPDETAETTEMEEPTDE